MRPQPGFRRWRSGGRLRRKAHAAAQVQAIAVGELAQAVQVELVHQRGGGRVDGIAVDPDLARHRGLVVAHARDQVQQTQGLGRGRLARRVERERRAGQGHRLDQLRPVVEAVHQLRDAAAGIEAAAHETEGADRVAVEHPLAHSMMSSAGRARRL